MKQINDLANVDDAGTALVRRQKFTDVIQQAAPSTTFDTFSIPSTSSLVSSSTSPPTIQTPVPVASALPSNSQITAIFDGCTTCGQVPASCTTCNAPSSSTPSSSSSSTSSRLPSTITTIKGSSSISSAPANTDSPRSASSNSSSHRGSTLGIALGISMACMVLLLAALCYILLQRRRKERQAVKEGRKVEKPFGEEGGFNSVVDTDASPTSVTPFSALPSRAVPAPASPSPINSPSPLTIGKSPKSPLTPPVEAPGPTTSGLDFGSNVELNRGAMPTQQNLLDQLTALKAQIQQVEALARTQGLNPSLSTTPAATEDGSEPPPEYDASMGAAARALVRDGKTSM